MPEYKRRYCFLHTDVISLGKEFWEEMVLSETGLLIFMAFIILLVIVVAAVVVVAAVSGASAAVADDEDSMED